MTARGAAAFPAFRAMMVAVAPLFVLSVLPAAAQVTVNPGVLDAPPTPARPAPRPPAARPAAAPRPAGPPNPPVPVSQPQVRVAPPAAPPVSPPAAPVVPPAVVVPLARLSPPAAVSVNPDAPGAAESLPGGGVRVTFGPDHPDLNPATENAIRSYAAAVKDNATGALNILAYAAGKPDDPSMPRRLSLARALATRSVLMAEGLPSTRIYVRALGAAATDGPADRVDVVPAAAPTPPPTPVAPTPPVVPAAPAAPAQAPRR